MTADMIKADKSAYALISVSFPQLSLFLDSFLMYPLFFLHLRLALEFLCLFWQGAELRFRFLRTGIRRAQYRGTSKFSGETT